MRFLLLVPGVSAHYPVTYRACFQLAGSEAPLSRFYPGRPGARVRFVRLLAPGNVMPRLYGSQDGRRYGGSVWLRPHAQSSNKFTFRPPLCLR